MKNYIKLGLVAAASFSSTLFLSSCDDDDDDDNSGSQTSVLENFETEGALLRVEFEATGPLGFAPVLFATHSGNVDFFDTGSTASAELEVMAEEGGVDLLIDTLTDDVNYSRSAGPTAPGTSFEVDHTVSPGNEYFSFVGMALPTSDTFAGNNNPLQYDLVELFEASNGEPLVIEVRRLYDAGTEINDFATSPGGPLVGMTAGDPTAGVDEGGIITLVTGNPFLNYANPDPGFDLSTINPDGELLGTITVTLDQ